MDIPIHAGAVCYDGLVGKSTYIVVDIVSEQVTHFAVKSDQHHKQYVVPIEKIQDSEITAILLAFRKEDVYQLNVFDESHFHGCDAYDNAPPMPSSGMLPSYPLYQPYRTAESPAADTATHFSAVELTINKGADILATDDLLGQVDELVIDSESHRITHLVLRQHFLLNKWIVTIPVSKIRQVEAYTIFLKIDSGATEHFRLLPLRNFLGNSGSRWNHQ